MKLQVAMNVDISMGELMSVLRTAGFSELANQFSRFIQRTDNTDDDLIPLTAALLSEAVSQGHVCLNLTQLGDEHSLAEQFPENVQDWIARLKQSHVVGQAGDYTPLILTDDGLLYLYRHWQAEQYIAKEIRQRCQPISVKNTKQLKQDFADWHHDHDGIDWQKVAVFTALTRQFSVISGGPGTGKTTIILRLLKMLVAQDADLKIALAAPTGKAAARLQQAIAEQGNQLLQAKTLHRLLGITADNDKGRYNQDRSLPVDIVIVDEASMIDLSLMAILMQALPEKAQLILLGDSQQLASVESGAVLANLCGQQLHYSTDFCQQLLDITGIELTPSKQQETGLSDSVVMLQHSYRFAESSDIGILANAVKSGDSQRVFDVLTSATTPIWQQQLDPATIQTQVFAGYHEYFNAVAESASPLRCLQLFEHYRVLCALKQGPQSVSSINALIARALQHQGRQTAQHFYHGRPIMVTQNDYRQQLFNGDTGLILHDETGTLHACFLAENNLRWIDLTRLPPHETAFAITIHKSQGSEFENVCVLLPEEDNAILNRELLYTAITRAKKQVMLLCSEEILTKTVSTQHQRETGLTRLLLTSGN